jgi:dihydrofolate synthase / folylpolyglutamate synthase
LNGDPVRWLFSLEHLGMKFGLENITALLAELGNPQHAFASVHIGGTNGKGSVTAIVETALRRAGFRAARYTSPHLERVEERFVINGCEVETGQLATAAGRVRAATTRLLERERLAGLPTFFEATTAAAFELFRMHRVEIAVVEVGLGGRLDSTNVLEPLVCAITTIDFDHQLQLGDTLAAIAAEKAGIIKTNVPVVIGRLPIEAESVVAEVARQRQAPLVRAHRHDHGIERMSPKLPGAHQRDNAVVALCVLETLRERGFAVTPEQARFAVEHVEWPGRLEHIQTNGCEVVLDAAHNPAGTRALADYLRDLKWGDTTLVFGAMADKDIRGMLRELVPVAQRVICTTPATPRAASAQTIASIVQSIEGAPDPTIVPEPHAALKAAVESSSHVVVAGSMFLIGPLRGILR